VEALARLAERQHGLVTRQHMAALGFTSAQINALLRAGRLERVAVNVYRFVGSVPTWEQRLLTAVLAQGLGAAAFGLSAAALWRVPGFGGGPVHVVQLRGPSRRSTLGRLHQTLWLPDDHLRVVSGIPVTSPARTAFDLCGLVHPKRAERAVDNLLSMELTTLGSLEVVLAAGASKGRPGSAVLRALLGERGEGYVPPESELEALLLARLHAAGLPRPRMQRNVGNTTTPIGRIDAVYEQVPLVVEADSRRYHGSWLAVQSDHRRDKLLIAAGYDIVRTNYWELTHEPDLLTDAVGAKLERAA
jgi:very-short-patch-repair endonuclease